MSRLRSRLPSDTLRYTLLVALGLPQFAACSGDGDSQLDVDAVSITENGQGGNKQPKDAGLTPTTPTTRPVETTPPGTMTSSPPTPPRPTGSTPTQPVEPEGNGAFVCEGERPLLDGEETGFFMCDGNVMHRGEALECPTQLPRSEVFEPTNPRPEGTDGGVEEDWITYDQCQQDSDCEGENGYCDVTPGWDQPSYLACRVGCRTDDDCNANQICLCGDPVGQCVEAYCSTAADCPEGTLCVGTNNDMGCGSQLVFACQFPQDECLTNADCEANGDENNACELQTWDGPYQRRCTGQSVCGRPFLVERDERRAPLVEGGDWAHRSSGDVSAGELSDAQREILAQHWAELGLMEHASIAAFARFSLQLLSLGAPRELVQRSNEAILDETRHAQDCFAVASEFARRRLGAGKLDVSHALDAGDAVSILRTVILEGCIGETQAALEAAHAAESAAPDSLRELLTTVTVDEGRHAELAWRFVAWLLKQQPQLGGVAEQCFDEARAARTGFSPNASDADPSLRRFGLLSAADHRRVQAEAWSAVIDPCAARLFADRASAAEVEAIAS